MHRQRTLKAVARTTGVGLHTGARVELASRPAAVDTGSVFHRTALPGSAPIPASGPPNCNSTQASASAEILAV